MRKHYPLNTNGAEDAGLLPWTDGVPQTGTEGSYPGQALFTDTEAEVLSVIDASGQARNGASLSQMAQGVSRGIFLGTFGGTANALTAGIPNGVIFPSLLPGMRFTGFASVTNSGSATVALGGIGSAGTPAVAIPLLRRAGGALQANDIPVGQPFDIIFDGSAFRFLGLTAQEVGVRKVDVRVTPGAGTFIAPPGVLNVLVEIWGAGGGGGGGNGSGQAGGGGAAGSYSAAFVAVIPGTTYNFTIGAGGTGGLVATNATSNGNSGGTTSIVIGGRTLTAPGGGGGQGGSIGALGGAPGVSSGGDENITGSQGGNYFSTTIAGMGGSAPRGGGGSGSGNAGNQPGGGAGGGSVSQAGTLGANGAIRFTY
ncbi:glycine-rich domain-containing protein [Methylobacterium mesophilicum]